MLKKIEAYIRNEKLDGVRLALIEIGVPAIDTVEVQGHGRQSGIKLAGRHSTYRAVSSWPGGTAPRRRHSASHSGEFRCK